MKIGIVYHRCDFDGLMGYAVIREHLEQAGDMAVPLPYNHGEPVPDLDGLDGVVIVDITLPTAVMTDSSLRKVWIEHHATAIKDSELLGYSSLPGLRAIGKGACELAWEYFHPGEDVPDVVKLLSTYDVFDKQRADAPWDDAVLPFQFGMRRRYNLDADRLFLAYATGAFTSFTVDRIIDEGRSILDYVRENGAKTASAYGFEVSVGNAGHKVLAILTDNFGSLPYEATARARGCCGVMCINRHGDDDYKVSIYAGDKPAFHIGEYLKETYGGGGHEGAGGCLIGKDVFLRLLSDKVF